MIGDQEDQVARTGPIEDASEDLLEEARERTVRSLGQSAGDGVSDPSMLSQNIRSALRKFFMEATKRKPVIVPVIMEV